MCTKRVMRYGKKIAPPVSKKPRFNFFEETYVSPRGVKTKVWSLPPVEMDSLNNIDTDTDSDASHDGILYPKYGVGVKPHESILRNSAHQISAGQTLGFTRRCKLNYFRRRRQILARKLIKNRAPSAAEMDSALKEEDEDAPPAESDRILIERIGMGTQPSNSAIGHVEAVPTDVQKELLFRSIATFLEKNGLSLSANVLMLEAKIKDDGGATPPDIEGFLLEFLKKGESKAQKEQLKLYESALDISC